ncbi:MULTISPECIES: MarR family transcriptional regulator [Pseudomonadota]|jgi:DNA-binding MarR family transcriptional regulator|uniref:MarR family winged helix-turn-helix transcriptional regulator n=1 Tax=Pseudomonadota TaxID=1224 RepID=UPI000769CE15|nr:MULTISPECIES: MarR family transcriptional regulator [Pseudomonadota]MAF60666.1 MarR family transcriptional regulator [Blastomonas sp.]MBA4781256.1 MarR family transcriptional regulator [Blastomonas sp.]|tara:strand:+ start:65842 stop:66342 length:501 start_codon:yes stop_codon:yes gene_type:complete
MATAFQAGQEEDVHSASEAQPNPNLRLWLRLLSCTTIAEKRLRRRLADQFDTTLPRFDVLAALEREPGGLAMSELSQRLLVSNGNVTAVVQQLARLGHVSVSKPEHDRRSSIVTMTDEGRAHFATVAREHHGWVEEMFAGIGADDRNQLYRLLAVLRGSLDQSEER